MKIFKNFRHLLIVAILCLSATAAHAQCNFQFNYTGSQTVTPGSTNFTNQTTHWTNAVIVDGTASMTAGPYGCPPLNGTPTHRPWVANSLYNQSIPLTGGGNYCVSCYIYDEIDQSADIGFGVDFTAGGTSQVACTVAGTVFLMNWNSGGKHFESAATLVKNTDPVNGGYDCDTSGTWFLAETSFVVPMFMPHYNGNSEIATCYYPVQDWCTNIPGCKLRQHKSIYAEAFG